jgi:hypothetical protein
MSTILERREITPEIKVLDEKAGIVEYVASDSSVDSYKEIIRTDAWNFSLFKRNPVFLNSHNYNGAENIFGKVIDMRVVGKSLVETVQWALGLGHEKAEICYNLTKGGFLKAVSVGFWPVKQTNHGDPEHARQLKDLGHRPDADVRTIFTEVEQIELSAVVVGANNNALACSIQNLALALKAGAITEPQLKTISLEAASREPATRANDPAIALAATEQARVEAFLRRIETAVNKLKGR